MRPFAETSIIYLINSLAIARAKSKFSENILLLTNVYNEGERKFTLLMFTNQECYFEHPGTFHIFSDIMYVCACMCASNSIALSDAHVKPRDQEAVVSNGDRN